MASKNSADERHEPNGAAREKWEKPALRRLEANLAEVGTVGKHTDGTVKPKKS